MSDFENDDIDKMFEEIISSKDMEEINENAVEAIISIETISVESLLKELSLISQSLSRAAVHINEIMLNFLSVKEYSLDDELKHLLGNIYKLTEDLDEYMIDLVLEDSVEFELLDEDDEEEDDDDD